MRVPSMVLRRGAMILFVLLQLAILLTTSTPAEPGTAILRRRRHVLLREKTTLLALKHGLNFSSHSVLADWNKSNAHVCSFTGVTCDKRREHVVGLALANLSISGALPLVIGKLTHLKSLDMSINSISDALPSSFYGNLTRLRYLDMSYNLISTNLGFLNMSNNLISGVIPPAIDNLTNLECLQMRSNLISGAIPPAIGNLTCVGE